MSDVRLSAATKALLAAARNDGPSAATRAKVWAGVSGSVGGAVGAASAAAAASSFSASATTGAMSVAAGGMSAMKMMVLGTLLGGTVTVGLGVAVLTLVPAERVHPSSAAVAAVEAPAPALLTLQGSNVTHASPPVLPATTSNEDPAAPTVIVPSNALPSRSNRAAAVRRPAPVDWLAREAGLVADARAALASGDARAAMRDVAAARALPSPQLVPEELAVQAQALRALGRADEARSVDVTLKSQFPESALVR